jgi:hypothetical protein
METIQSFVNQLSIQSQDFTLGYLIANIILVLLLSAGLSFHYLKYGRTTGNRTSLASTFPFIATTILLVIIVVKSSLALSLGLVGALSIVRFRTPIKEPEELAYLFFAIAIGLGIGADQRIPVITVYIFILIFLTIRSLYWSNPAEGNMILTIQMSSEDSEIIDKVNSISAKMFPDIDLRRFDTSTDRTSLTYLVSSKDATQLTIFRKKILKLDDKLEMTVVEQSQIY